jgi:UTP--glucose-1-phosphate uridylyltransferase
MSEVKKAVVLAGGLDTHFLPLSRTVPKELWPLVDKPIIQYALEELKASGIRKIVFVLGPDRKQIPSYFKKELRLEKKLKKRKEEKALIELENLKELQRGLSLSFVSLQEFLGDGDAVLKVKKEITKNPFVLLSALSIVQSKTPCTLQLLKMFKTCQRSIVALSRVPKGKTAFWGMVKTQKIAHRLFKLKGIVKKSLSEEVSDLAIVGKYVLTPEIFDYLKNQKPDERGEIVLADALEDLLKDGKMVYGYEIEGEWLGCEDKLSWLKSHMRFSLKHPRFGEELKKYLKEIM